MESMTSCGKTYLAQYPELAIWFTEIESESHEQILHRFCEALDCVSIQDLTKNLSGFLNHIRHEFSHTINDKIEFLESSCSLYKLNFQSFLVSTIEEGFSQDQYEELSTTVKSIGSESHHPIFCFIAAWISLNENELEDCIKFCDKSSDMSSDFYGIKGQALLELKIYKEAQNCFECATELAPQEPLHWFWLAKTSFALGMEIESWLAAEQCQKLAPLNLEANMMLGVIACEADLDIKYKQKTWDILNDNNHCEVFLIQLKLGTHLEDEALLLTFIRETKIDLAEFNEESMKTLGTIIYELRAKGWGSAIEEISKSLKKLK